MKKRNNKYKIHLQEIELKDGTQSGEFIEFEFENHDNILEIIKKIQAKNILEDKNKEIEFAVGLKLFSEVLLQNRKNPLFEDINIAFRDFMKKIKNK